VIKLLLLYVFHINENYHIMRIRGAQPLFEKKLIFIQKIDYYAAVIPNLTGISRRDEK